MYKSGSYIALFCYFVEHNQEIFIIPTLYSLFHIEIKLLICINDHIILMIFINSLIFNVISDVRTPSRSTWDEGDEDPRKSSRSTWEVSTPGSSRPRSERNYRSSERSERRNERYHLKFYNDAFFSHFDRKKEGKG